MTAKKELLAPAGDIEAGYAALYYGADAIYLGLKQFSARATANNFAAQELNEFTGYAHSLGKKVFVTINTVLQENELPDLIKNLDICRAAHIDALIVQDLGVAGVVKQYYPEIALHASTQMAVHNKEGALALQKLGFERVVLARELTLKEIQDIATIKGLELECFIHGALCYSYSGICQFSSFDCGRSANRGKCMYPCRAEFIKDGKKSHCFSMKDLALEEDILKLPVYSLKIEGRKKTALYVAAVVDYYRRILNGEKNLHNQADNIKQIFARPWCKFHFNGKDKAVVDREFVGHRGLEIGKIEEISGRKIIFTPSHRIARHDGLQIDINGEEKPFGFALQNLLVNGKNVFEAQKNEKVEVFLPKPNLQLQKGQKIYLSSSSEVKGAYDYTKPKPKEFWQKPSVDIEINISSDKITAQTRDAKSEISGLFTTAQNIAKMNDAIQKAFTKTGDVAFDLGQLKIKNPQGLFVPISTLNELRRNLYDKVKVAPEEIIILPPVPRKRPTLTKWIIQVDKADKCSKLNLGDIDEIIYLLSEDTKLADLSSLPADKLRLALPIVCRQVSKFKPIIAEMLAAGYKKWEVNNYWGFSVLPDQGIDLSLGNMIYMFNTQAVAMAQAMGVSRITAGIEDTADNLQKIAAKSPLPIVFTVYQNAPLFTSAVCVRDNSCGECDKRLKWSKLEKDGQHYLLKSENCQTEVYSLKPFSAADELQNLLVDYAKADFCHIDYSADDVAAVWQKICRGENPRDTNKANLNRTIF